MKKLEIGPGTAPLEGYETLDRYAHHNPTYLVNIEEPYWFELENNIFDEVVAVHVLEHVAINKVQNVFNNVYRILKPGGVFRVHVPNGPVLINAYIKFPEKREITQVCIYGCESQEEGKYDVAHKVLYDSQLLQKQFNTANFKDVKDITKEWDDRHDPYWQWMSTEDKFSLKVSGIK
jgi:predicted SAM-dependent methyltransferase